MTDATNHLPQNTSAPVADGAATILVIDDDPAMRMILSLSLKLLGYVMLAAGDGEEALAIARDHPEIRVVILDVVMSGLSGKKLADQLKTNLPEAAVLFCSGHPASVMARYDIDVNSAHFLQKPCRPPELQQKIEELMGTS